MRSCLLLATLVTACAELPRRDARTPSSEGLAVETRGVAARIEGEARLAAIPSGPKNLYKLRITSIDIAPGGYVGHHNHVGPGIRLMTVGRMEYVMPELTLVYGPGEHFFETGDVDHVAYNDSNKPNQHLLFEILPADLTGPSLIPSSPQSRVQTDLSGLVKPET